MVSVKKKVRNHKSLQHSDVYSAVIDPLKSKGEGETFELVVSLGTDFCLCSDAQFEAIGGCAVADLFWRGCLM